jgi:beta-xylosidase
MDQGSTSINGPHQGAWVDTKTGEHWFIHFQDRGAYGRVTLLEPMKWVNDWPVIGVDKDGDGKGEPVLTYKKPNVGGTYAVETPQESDEFNDYRLGLQWQWQANPQPYWAFPGNGYLRLFSWQIPDSAKNMWFVPNLLLQKFPAEQFTATVKLDFKPRLEGEKTGLIVMGYDYAWVGLTKKADGIYLSYVTCKQAESGKPEEEKIIGKINGPTVYFRVQVSKDAKCNFSYSEDGPHFTSAGDVFTAQTGRWIGAKMGLFCTRSVKTNDSGFADVDWFRIE